METQVLIFIFILFDWIDMGVHLGSISHGPRGIKAATGGASRAEFWTPSTMQVMPTIVALQGGQSFRHLDSLSRWLESRNLKSLRKRYFFHSGFYLTFRFGLRLGFIDNLGQHRQNFFLMFFGYFVNFKQLSQCGERSGDQNWLSFFHNQKDVSTLKPQYLKRGSGT